MSAASQVDDPFEPSPQLSRAANTQIDAALERLTSYGVDFAVIFELSRVIRNSPDQVAGRIRPVVFARDIGLPKTKVIDACLAAAYAGLLVYRWEIHCPSCHVPTSHVDHLSEIATHGRCQVCHMEFQNDLNHLVELTFHVHPAIRRSDDQIYCIGGPWHLPKVSTQCVLEGAEQRAFPLALSRRRYQVGSPQLRASVILDITANANSRHASIVFSEDNSGVEHFEKQLVVRIERMDSNDDALLAAEVVMLPTFRRRVGDELKARPT